MRPSHTTCNTSSADVAPLITYVRIASAAYSFFNAAIARKVLVGLPKLTRSETGVFVLNGNGRSGAAAGEARKLSAFGYRVPATANAKRQDYATTVIMYRRGYNAEALRLARDLHVLIVGPLDGLKPAALHGGQLAVLLGAR